VIKQMLRIQKDFDGRATTLRLSGRIQADSIAAIRSVMNDACAPSIMDLTEVILVDLAAVQFLIRCENEGVELRVFRQADNHRVESRPDRVGLGHTDEAPGIPVT
jgi:hypothetical protein